jgi:hypothetical protein
MTTAMRTKNSRTSRGDSRRPANRPRLPKAWCELLSKPTLYKLVPPGTRLSRFNHAAGLETPAQRKRRLKKKAQKERIKNVIENT